MPFTLRQMCIWTQHANWWLLYQVPQGNLLYHYSTQAVNLGSIPHGFTYRTVYRTLCFSVKCPSFLEHLSQFSCQYPSHLSHHWIILSSGHESWPSSSFSAEAYNVRVVGRGEFESPKPPKRHIKHELNAHLSTPLVFTLPFLLWYPSNKLYVVL